jgi:hypothetical protein
VAEWFKAHAWKVCVRQKRTVGSNPTPSVVPLVFTMQAGHYVFRRFCPCACWVEIDGLERHGLTQAQFARDYFRARRLVIGGHIVVRFTVCEAMMQPG